MASERYYTWFIVLYSDRLQYQPLLDKATHWALCKHDKDWKIDDEGNKVPKEPHTHIIATFPQNISYNTLCSYINDNQTVMAKPCKARDGNGKEQLRHMFAYLIHENEDENEKHIYETTDRITDDDSYWEKRINLEKEKADEKECFMQDLLSEDYNIKEMGIKYGKDFIKNIGQYEAYRNRILYEESMYEINMLMDDLITIIKASEIKIDILSGAKPNIKHAVQEEVYKAIQKYQYLEKIEKEVNENV